MKSDIHRLKVNAEKKIHNDKKENWCIDNSAEEMKVVAESINPTKNEDENINDFSCHLQTDITIKEEPIESVDIKNESFLPYDNGIKIEVDQSW